MNNQGFEVSRSVRCDKIETDVVVVGGGLTGVCCAITAARRGAKVVLVQDRPILGGNASSEVRLWALGATSHMGNNNRWSREGGVIDEIMTENVYRNREGNPVIFDTVLLDKVLQEPNIMMLLDTVAYQVNKSADNSIESITAYNAINETRYEIKGRFFADCSGDGLVGYLAGASYRMGAEDKEVYGEMFAPDKKVYGELLGHTILFYMKDTGKPVKYVAPQFALKDAERHISKIDNDEYFSIHHHGCKFWWIEYGGRLDTIHDSESIKQELWKVVYGIWDYIKNSGKYPQMDSYTLEWVGTIPGKRESRRMNGLYTLIQQDIIEQRTHYDAVSYGGWAIDLHPSNGVYADGRACNQWHSKGVYQIPYRCYVGQDIRNLMFGGRIMSSSHVANGSTRVMCTSASGGQVIGTALSLCVKNNRTPLDFVDSGRIGEIQQALIADGQYIPGVEIQDSGNLLHSARIKASSEFQFKGYSHNGNYRPLIYSTAALFPVNGVMPRLMLEVKADEATTLDVELRCSTRKNGYTPDKTLGHVAIPLKQGIQRVVVDFGQEQQIEGYGFVCFMANEKVSLAESDDLVTGTTTVLNQVNHAVSNLGVQQPPQGIGIEQFEFWCPQRRPQGKNIAFELESALNIFSTALLANSYTRPVGATNAWAASLDDEYPELVLEWDGLREIKELTLFFDTDYDHAMETVQMGHAEQVMPYCVRRYEVRDDKDNILVKKTDNYQARNRIVPGKSVKTTRLSIRFKAPGRGVPAALFHIIVK